MILTQKLSDQTDGRLNPVHAAIAVDLIGVSGSEPAQNFSPSIPSGLDPHENFTEKN